MNPLLILIVIGMLCTGLLLGLRNLFLALQINLPYFKWLTVTEVQSSGSYWRPTIVLFVYAMHRRGRAKLRLALPVDKSDNFTTYSELKERHEDIDIFLLKPSWFEFQLTLRPKSRKTLREYIEEHLSSVGGKLAPA